MEHVLDAKNQKLGRLASKITLLLQGKHAPAYRRRLSGTDRVRVKNIRALDLGHKKFDTKAYYRHTGPLGHLKARAFRETFERDPSWALRNAVRLMLPKNRIQKERLKRLIIEK